MIPAEAQGRKGALATSWERKGISVAERFKYLYSREEVSEWVPRIQALASQTREVHALFNNCYADYGTRNARDLQDLVRGLQPSLFREPSPTE